MTLNELAEVSKSKIKVLSAYNSKMLCRCFDKNKDAHKQIGTRNVNSMWAEVETTKSCLGNIAIPIVCVYVDGHQEAMEASRKQK